LYKLLATDLDGTLLDARTTVSRSTAATLRDAERRGLQIVICTGRAYSSAFFYARELGLQAYILSANGAQARDPDGNQLFLSPMADHLADSVIDIAHQFRLPFEMFTPHAVVSDTKPYRSRLWDALG